MPDPAPAPAVNPAIAYAPDGFLTNRRDLKGRHAAGEGFLQGFLRHAGHDRLWGYMLGRDMAQSFNQVARALGARIPLSAIPASRTDALAARGVLQLPDPGLANSARRRSFLAGNPYAITGLTHTTATPFVMGCLADLATAPIQPWDALICTSRAVVATVRAVLEFEEYRLRQRLGATRFVRPMLPVIPLGVDAQRFSQSPELRADWRTRLGLGPHDLAVLSVGRLTLENKAHPLPLFASLGRAARRLQGQRLHLVLAGFFEAAAEEALWRDMAAGLCPEVTLHLQDGRQPEVRGGVWSAADIFALLVDNVQETFGLAPVEAMAAGLPVVATDWDGFRDTVRHGQDGFLVPTLMSPAGTAADIASRFANNAINYPGMLGAMARLTAVDIAAAAEAFVALAEDPALRWRMGDAGRRRVAESFDWSVVIPQYQKLWDSQQALRLAATDPGETRRGDPRHPDPSMVFTAYPSRQLRLSTRLRPAAAGAEASPADWLRWLHSELPGGPDAASLAKALAGLRSAGELSVRELGTLLPRRPGEATRRLALTLLRCGLAELAPVAED